MVSPSVGTRARSNNGVTPPLTAAGSSGLKQYNGYVREEFRRELAGPRGMSVYAEMVTDPVVHAMLFAIDMLMRQVEWHTEPDAEGDDPLPEELEAAQFIEECRNDLNRDWREVISEINEMCPFGWSWMETTFKRREGPEGTSYSKFDDGRWGWARIDGRAQDSLVRWEFDEQGDTIGLWQQAPSDPRTVFVSRKNSLHFRTSSRRNNPEGRSLLYAAYKPYYYKKHFENIRAIGIERDLAGLPTIYIDASYFDPAAPAYKQQILADMKTLVSSIRRDEAEGLLVPLEFDEKGNQLVKVELLNSGGERQVDINGTIEYEDQRILLSILADFLLLGHEQVGSFALADTKTSVFASAIGSLLDVIAGEFNSVAIPYLLRINGIDVKRMPKLVHGDLDQRNFLEVAQFLQALSAAGAQIFPHDDLINTLLEEAKLPPIPEDRELVPTMGGPSPTTASVSGAAAPTPNGTATRLDNQSAQAAPVA